MDLGLVIGPTLGPIIGPSPIHKSIGLVDGHGPFAWANSWLKPIPLN